MHLEGLAELTVSIKLPLILSNLSSRPSVIYTTGSGRELLLSRSVCRNTGTDVLPSILFFPTGRQ